MDEFLPDDIDEEAEDELPEVTELEKLIKKVRLDLDTGMTGFGSTKDTNKNALVRARNGLMEIKNRATELRKKIRAMY